MRFQINYIKVIRTFVLVFVLSACLDPYSLPLAESDVSYLVVDGYINASTNVTTVKLSRALGLTVAEAIPPETDALVSIESEDGIIISLSEKDKGLYEGATPVNISKKYQLHFVLRDGKEYRSDFIQLKTAPPIDSISWKPDINGVTIYANAHDDTRQTRYYKWNFTETWVYTSPFFSAYKRVNGAPVLRKIEEYIYECWGTEISSQILVGTTVRLNNDVINEIPLTMVPKGSRKIAQRYSILVEQRALDEEGYDYWSKLQKTTENLGGLFDPLPSQVSGNVFRIDNSAEPVLGYFSGGTVQEKRIFIRFADLPDYLLVFNSGMQCELLTVPLAELPNLGGDKLIVDAYGVPLAGYTASTYDCVDCRVLGGTTTKPDFWP